MVRRRRKIQGNTPNLATAIFGIVMALIILTGHQAFNDFVSVVLVVFLTIVVAFGLIWYLRMRRKVELRAFLLAAGTENPMQLTPEQYEQFCAALLKNSGWDVELTKKSGDFGADIIAEKEGRKVIIQCKRWSNSVGVKAVQEAHTAISHYRADRAIVVATAGYTQPAKELAKSTGVRLLSHADLGKI